MITSTLATLYDFPERSRGREHDITNCKFLTELDKNEARTVAARMAIVVGDCTLQLGSSKRSTSVESAEVILHVSLDN